MGKGKYIPATQKVSYDIKMIWYIYYYYYESILLTACSIIVTSIRHYPILNHWLEKFRKVKKLMKCANAWIALNYILRMDYTKAGSNPTKYIRENLHKNTLFCIHRSMNQNVVVYTANMIRNNAAETASLSLSEPVQVLWCMFESLKGSESVGYGNKVGVSEDYPKPPEEGITFFEKRFFGVSLVEEREGVVCISIAALPDRPIRVSVHKIEDGGWNVQATTTIAGVNDCKLERVFVEMAKNMVGLPKVKYITIHGSDPQGNAIQERKIP